MVLIKLPVARIGLSEVGIKFWNPFLAVCKRRRIYGKLFPGILRILGNFKIIGHFRISDIFEAILKNILFSKLFEMFT